MREGSLHREYLESYGVEKNMIIVRLPENGDIFNSTTIENYKELNSLIGEPVMIDDSFMIGKITEVLYDRILKIEINTKNNWILNFGKPLDFGFNFIYEEASKKAYDIESQSFIIALKNIKILSFYLRLESKSVDSKNQYLKTIKI